jgi:hypothetical protein
MAFDKSTTCCCLASLCPIIRDLCCGTAALATTRTAPTHATAALASAALDATAFVAAAPPAIALVSSALSTAKLATDLATFSAALAAMFAGTPVV